MNKKYKSRTIGNHQLSPETLMMGYGYSPSLSEGSLKPPVFQTSTFVFQTAEEGKAFFELAYGLREKEESEEIGLIYSRINNPNLEVLEDRLAVWDNAEKSLVFASGMAAISTSLWAYLRPGDVLICSEPIYGGTEYLSRYILPEFNIKRVGFNAEDGEKGMEVAAQEARDIIKETGGRVGAIFLETPANPTNGLVDIALARRISESFSKDGTRPPVIVDNTFLGPLWQTPLDHGADITIMSLTKYVGGHSDLIAGSSSGSEKWMGPIQGMRTILGTMADPHTGWILMRSLETLKLRMEASNAGAKKVASFLKAHEKVSAVWHLDDLPDGTEDKELFERQCRAGGSTFAFEIHGGEAEAFKVLNALQVIKLAVSLGGTETLASHPAAMTHSDFTQKDRDRLGIKDSLIRISVGVENPEDLIVDLAQALDQISGVVA
ncbi:MAG: cystathionine gamma-synthase family protein [Alphaproteobacteria bacterium]|nr:cystathionine gamma-synthase family protein [Alphaproteobacteria bacterium]